MAAPLHTTNPPQPPTPSINPVLIPLPIQINPAQLQNGPLVWAAENGHAACVELLIGRHANLDAPGYLGATAVNRAARRGHTDCLELLLAAGANPDLPNVKLQHPLHFAGE